MGTILNNIFIEGIQGAGKSTLLNLLHSRLPEYKAYREGDLSPVELAWCTYMTKQQYEHICFKYQDIISDIETHTITEGNRKITAYTQIITDIPGFHKFMEQFEIYHGRVSFNEFKDIVFKRYASFDGNGNIFECSFFQYSIECMMLYYQMDDKDIINFYKEAYDILRSKNFRLIYIDVEDVEAAITTIRKERVDTKGNELWYPLMIKYLSQTPQGKAHNLNDFDSLVCHLKKRRDIELRVIEDVGEAITINSKKYDIDMVVSWCSK